MGLRRWWYERAYARDRAPWDTGVTPPEVVERVEGDLEPGRALDLGCGTGTNLRYLASHGWAAVGIDFSDQAVEAARAKIAEAPDEDRARLEVHVGDVTDLAAAGVEGPFDLAVDIGCYHNLISTRTRMAYAREVARVLRPGGLLLVFSFGAATARPKRGKIRMSQIEAVFGGAFDIERVEPGTRPPGAAWFTMRRR